MYVPRKCVFVAVAARIDNRNGLAALRIRLRCMTERSCVAASIVAIAELGSSDRIFSFFGLLIILGWFSINSLFDKERLIEIRWNSCELATDARSKLVVMI